MNRYFVSVDVGRSSIKSLATGQKDCHIIPSVVATDFGSFSGQDNSIMNMSLEKDIAQMEVVTTQGDWNKGLSKLFLFGEHALLSGSNNQMEFTEGAMFHKFSVASILYCCARYAYLSGKNEIHLAINLTFSNNQFASFYSASLKGAHQVMLSIPGNGGGAKKEKVSFSIKSLHCFQQGYASVFNFLGVQKYSSVIENGVGAVIDIGRYTVDLSYVDKLTLVRGESKNTGTNSLVHSLVAEAAKAGFNLSPFQIEQSFLDRTKFFRNLQGHIFKPSDIMVKNGLLKKYYAQINLNLNNFLGDGALDYIVLCGGGAYLIKSMFVGDFKVPVLPISYVDSNCRGMLRFLQLV
jgi:hypothetical protein